MIRKERRLVKPPDCEWYEEGTYEEGYFLTIEQINEICRDFSVDCMDGYVSNDIAYLELWLKNKKQK